MHWGLIANSFMVASGATLGAMVLGGAVACWARMLPGAARAAVQGASTAALALPSFLVLNAWLDLLAPGGWVTRVVSLPVLPLAGASAILALLYWPISYGALLAALDAIPREHLEIEPRIRGLRLVRGILWPATRDVLGVSALLVFVLSLNQFSVPSLLQVRVLGAEVWVRYATQLDAVAALAAGWPLLVLPVGLLAGWRPVRFPRAALLSCPDAALFRRQLGPALSTASCGVGVVVLGLSLMLPLVLTLRGGHWGAEFLPVLRANLRPAAFSFLFAAGTATLVLSAGLAGHVLWRLGTCGRWAQRLRRGMGLGGWFLFFIPGIFLGVFLAWAGSVLPMPGLRSGILLSCVALTARYFALGWNGVAAARRDLDPDLLNQAALTGVRGLRWCRDLLWAQQGGWLRTVWYAVYVLALWDVESLVLVQAPGGETLALRIFNLLHYGHNDQVNSLCLHLLALAALPGLVWILLRGGVARGRRLLAGCLAGAGLLPGLCGCAPTPAETSASLKDPLFARVEVVGTRGTASGQFNKPRSLTVDRDDNLYVVDMTGRVQKFDPSGRFLLLWQLPQTELGKPKGMTLDRDGNIVVVEPHYQRVNHFSTSGQLLLRWGTPGTNGGQLTLPRSAAVNSHGRLYVTEYTTVDRVQGFDPGTNPVPRLLFGRPGPGPGEFNRAEGIGIDRSDRVYVADSCNHRIQVFDAEGHFLRTHGRAGSGPGELSYPYDIALDPGGRQYVCEFGNSRVQVFDDRDRRITSVGGYGSRPGEMSNPWAIALDSRGNLYVADAGNHRVLKFVRK
jgi:ABC-type Fe3+ transport system permease subunit